MPTAGTHTPAPEIRDPLSRVRYRMEPAGEDLVMEACIEPGGALLPHLHPEQEEVWTVLEGKVRFRLGRGERVIAPEDGEVHVGRGMVHSLTNLSDSEVRLHCVVTPALQRQSFLEEGAAAARDGLLTAQGFPRGLTGARFAAAFLRRYRREVVFVSPPRSFQLVLMALLGRGA